MKTFSLCRPGIVNYTLAFILPCIVTLSAPAQEESAHEHLKFALILTRHGVRSPTWTNERLDEFSKEAWPKWDVAPGLLTPHGKTLMTQFGAYYRQSFAVEGLISRMGCADADQVYVRADTDERTLETGRGLMDGMWPGCNAEVHSLGAGVNDPLFHPDGRIGAPDNALALAAVSGRIGQNPAALLPAYESQLNSMQGVLSGCVEQICSTSGRKQLLDIAPVLAKGKQDHLVELKGPLATGATFAENFQLEYLEGMPADQVGWGRIHEKEMRSLMAIHAASSDILQRTPYVARVQASNLLTQMLRTIEQAESGKPVAGAIGAPSDRIVFLVGHDTNIGSVAALLDAHWLVNGYQRDDAAPGGALVFELWQQEGHPDKVRIYYSVQTPQQMRNALTLSLAQPPAKAVVFLPACGETDSSCTLARFESLVSGVADPSFVQLPIRPVN
jgi:4-phytase/acid phosphatase